MAKTLLEFEDELIDVMSIYRVSRREYWNEEKEGFDYCIIFNPDFPDKYLVKDLIMKFESSEFRDKKIQELKRKIGELEHVLIL
jgi:hypothetical protein